MGDEAQPAPAMFAALARHHPDADRQPLERALAKLPADGPRRDCALTAAALLGELRMDPPPLCAALLVYGEAYDAKTIEQDYGNEVLELCKGLRRVLSMQWDRLDESAVEPLRKMLIAMASDVRVVLMALAGRTWGIRNLARDDPAAENYARVSLEVFAPLANRLGVWQLKWELEDLSLKHLDPEAFAELKALLANKRDERSAYVKEVIEQLTSAVAEHGIKGRVSGRPKHIYSIYKKMRRKGVGFEQIYDRNAVRIIVDRVEDCYAILGVVHGRWTPIDGEFDDYIAKPKPNNYRSLHTAVVGPGGHAVEIQIRTAEMHEFAEYGVAAHWAYKEGRNAGRRTFDQRINWLRQLIEWQKEVADPEEFVESLKTDVLREQVYVFTPQGDVVDLAEGATPLDFAYRVHTMVGHRCKGAKVNGSIVPLDTALATGDRVEIITGKTPNPSRDWLNANQGYLRTSTARAKVRQWFRQQQRDESIIAGRDAIERELRRVGHEGAPLDELPALFDVPDLESLYAVVGYGDISPQAIASRVLERARSEAEPEPPPPPTSTRRTPKAASGVRVLGVSGVLCQPARCCNPVPGDDVLGWVTRGRGVNIHRRDCVNVRHSQEPDRLVEVDWGEEHRAKYPVSIRVLGDNRAGLLRDVSDVVAAEGLSLLGAAASSDPAASTAQIDLQLEVRGSSQLVRLLNRIQRLSGVVDTHRLAE